MKFGVKRVVAVVILIAGIVAILYAVNAMGKIATAKKTVGGLSGFLSQEKYVGKSTSDQLEKEVSKYDVAVMVLLIGGIVLVIAGGTLLIRFKKKR